MKNHIVKTLENSRDYTLKVAESMAEESYSFKPIGASWSFLELIHHIAYGIEWWNENHIKGNKIDWDPGVVSKGKKEAIAYLKKAFKEISESINKSSLTNKEILGFYATVDHITHHRGQAVLYLRCKGIDPPEYIY